VEGTLKVVRQVGRTSQCSFLSDKEISIQSPVWPIHRAIDFRDDLAHADLHAQRNTLFRGAWERRELMMDLTVINGLGQSHQRGH
jgi:hypothetical protein